MPQDRLKVSVEDVEPDRAGLFMQELRNELQEQFGQEIRVIETKSDPESMQLFDVLLIDLLVGGACHAVLLYIHHRLRPPGATLRIEKDGQVVLVSDANPKSLEELKKLQPSTATTT